MIQLLLDGNDVIIGKRSADYFKQIPFSRKLMSKSFSFVAAKFFGMHMPDSQSGIKGFNQNGKMEFLATSINRFLAETEFVLRACNEGLIVKSVLIKSKPHLSFSNFGMMTIFKEMINFLKLVYLRVEFKMQG